MAWMSSSGLSGAATMSAYLPGSMLPRISDLPSRSAALVVAD